MLFDRDDWGPEVMRGLTPRPTKADDCAELFNRTAAPFRDAFTGPIIHDRHVYVFGESYGKLGKGRAICVEIASGQVMWNQAMKNNHQHSSAVVADGKIITIGVANLYLVKATPEKYVELGKARLGLEKYASVAAADGKVFLKTGKKVVCYDLSK